MIRSFGVVKVLIEGKNTKCEIDGCVNLAIRIYYSKRRDTVFFCCNSCSEKVWKEDLVEDTFFCKNCGCENPYD